MQYYSHMFKLYVQKNVHPAECVMLYSFYQIGFCAPKTKRHGYQDSSAVVLYYGAQPSSHTHTHLFYPLHVKSSKGFEEALLATSAT